MSLPQEIKRKLFHQLSLAYLLLYALWPRELCLWLLGIALMVLGALERWRVRRPEVNAWFLEKFGGLHRPSEVLGPSGIFWTLLGCWLTMLLFTNKFLVLAALGFLTFGDAAAALVGRRYGKHPWKKNPAKTHEGSAAFAMASLLWALPFVRWPVAVLGAAAVAWIEARPLPWNDNLWVPVLSAFCLSVLNMALGGH